MASVLFLIFNRPEPTRIVFEQIRLAKPSNLFVAADGPRLNKNGEYQLCEETRSIVKLIDWECEVKTLFRTENLGCGKAVSSAVDWFFENVEEGIILEDDCLPNQSFFTFCEEMLRYYKDDHSVMHIGGTNYQNGIQRGDGSYYFSRFTHIWGWATWRNRWVLYDFSLEKYKDQSTEGLGRGLTSLLDSVRNNEIDTWDIQWFMSVWFNEGLSITPNVNLVKNIGYGIGATHTFIVPRWLKLMHSGEINNITYPSDKKLNSEADIFVRKIMFDHSRFSIKYLFKTIYKIIFRTTFR